MRFAFRYPPTSCAITVKRQARIMVHRFLFGNKSHILLSSMLDKAAVAQRVIAANVANVGTPGYKRLAVSFDEELARATAADRSLKRTDPRHLPDPDWHESIKPKVAVVEDGYWNGINNVDIDREMVDLAKNQLDFTIAARLKSMMYSGLRTAIRGR